MWNFRLSFTTALLAAAVSGYSAPVLAEGPGSSPPTTQDQIDALDQKIRILERRAELEKESADQKTKEAATLGAGKDGFYLKSADGNFRLRVGGLLQADTRIYEGDEDKRIPSTFVLRRVRPIIEGTVFQYYDLRIIPDFAEGKTALIDAYLDVHPWPQASLRAGKQKTPFGLERLQSATDIRFVERALPTALVPNRDVGLQIYGSLGEDFFTYSLGVFNGVLDGASGDFDNRDEKDLAARVFVQPFKTVSAEALQRFGLGVAATFGGQKGPLPSFKTGGQQTFFSYKAESKTGAKDDAQAGGERFRISPQGYYYWGPFGLIGEYVRSSQEVKKDTISTQEGQEVRTAASAQIAADAWQVAATYILTGEPNSFKGVQPSLPFTLGAKGWGAWELAARYSELRVDKVAFDDGFADPAKSAERAQALAVGLNWVLNKNFKLVLDFERTEFKGGAKDADREPENAVLTRLQLFL